MVNLVSLSCLGSSSNVEVLWAFFPRMLSKAPLVYCVITLFVLNTIPPTHAFGSVRKISFNFLLSTTLPLFPPLKSTRTCWSSWPICCLEVTSPVRNRRKPSSTPSRTPRWRWCARPDAIWTWCASTVRTWTRSWCHRVTETEVEVAMRTETEMGRRHRCHRRRFLLLWQCKNQQQMQHHQSLTVNKLFEQPFFF